MLSMGTPLMVIIAVSVTSLNLKENEGAGHSRAGRIRKGRKERFFTLSTNVPMACLFRETQDEKWEKLWEEICSNLSFAFYFL